MGIRDRVNQRTVIDREVLGEKVKVRKLSATQMLQISELPPLERPKLLIAQTILDEAGEPLFASAAAAGEVEWPEFEAMLAVSKELNRTDGDKAGNA